MARQDLFAGTRRRTHHTTQRTPAEEVEVRMALAGGSRHRIRSGEDGPGQHPAEHYQLATTERRFYQQIHQ